MPRSGVPVAAMILLGKLAFVRLPRHRGQQPHRLRADRFPHLHSHRLW